MKREIKFRGLTIGGEWVYGLLATKGKNSRIYTRTPISNVGVFREIVSTGRVSTS
jgi:hypothetical protein